MSDTHEGRAWALYCSETHGTMDARDFWRELAPGVREQYLARTANPDADGHKELAVATDPIPAGTLTVRKLRRMLDGLDAGTPIVLEGTEYDLPAGRADLIRWHETEQSGRPTGRSADALIIRLHEGL
jgi:hypothetical protein